MSRSLILDYNVFNVDKKSLQENMQINGGRPIVKGVLQRADAKNHNGRVYPKNILEREAQKYTEEFINQNRALGTLDHPDSATVELANTSHRILKMWWEGNDLMGVVEILPTPSGNILKNLFEAEVTLGISSRGLGSIREVYSENNEKYTEVQEDFELISFDFVSNPSTKGAFLTPINEGVRPNLSDSSKIDLLIGQIICDIQGICPVCPKK